MAPGGAVELQPEIHRVEPESGSTLKALIGIFSQTAGSTCKFWVNPVDFTFAVSSLGRALPWTIPALVFAVLAVELVARLHLDRHL